MADYDITELDKITFDTTNAESIAIDRVPNTNFVIASWARTTSVVLVQCFSVDPVTGALAAIGSPVDIETGTITTTYYGTAVRAIDENNAIVVWSSVSTDGFSQLLSIDGSGNVSLNGSAYEFDNADQRTTSMYLLDSTHALVVGYQSSSVVSNGARARVLTFNTSTPSISTSAALVISSLKGEYCHGVAVDDTTYIIYFRNSSNANSSFAVLNIDTGTWTASLVAAPVTADSNNITGSGIALLENDARVVVATVSSSDAYSIQQYLTSHIVDVSTGARTAFGTPLALSTWVSGSNHFQHVAIANVDSTHVLVMHSNASNIYRIGVFEYDPSTGDFTEVTYVEGSATFDYANWADMLRYADDSNMFITARRGVGNDGFMQSFNIDIPSAGGGVKNPLFMFPSL